MNAQEPTSGRHSYRDVKKNLIRGSKMLPLPCEETKVVVRPRGGLCISKSGASVVAEAIWSLAGLGPEERNTDTMCPNHLQNIMVISTSSQENVKRHVNVEAITVAGQRHEVSAYVAAPQATCKGVIHGIPLSDDPGAIDRKNVNARNSLALGAKRIKNTGVIIVLFDGECLHRYRIPYVVRRRRGLRARALRERSPSVNVDGFLELNDCHQQVQPGPSAPGGRFKSRGRSRTRGSFRSRSTSRLRLACSSRSGARSMSRTRSQSRGGTRPRPSSGARSGSGLGPGQGKTDAPSTRPDPSPRTDCGHARGLQLSGAVHATEDQSRGKSNLTWADRVRSNDGEQPMQCDPSPEHARDAEILRLKKENAELKDTLTKMAYEMAEFKRMLSTMHSKAEGETTDTLVSAPIGDGPWQPNAERQLCDQTTPDLAFIKNVEKTTWANTAMDFGSDHYVLQTSIIVNRSRVREFTVVDWDLFHSIRGTKASAPDNFKEWCEGIRRDTTAATKTIKTDLNVENMDRRLAHLLEAMTALFSRWKKQRHNRRLRQRISKLNKEIEQHCNTLCKQEWDELCESVDGQIRNGKS
ncbi:hypothetical protein HPB51_000336 [Rhipicephalus microplus]|uniref:Tick transposon n=1 Tax=Rhipicephalus microplus TaxID=6941 RepID=A0A9J6EQI4_RHIMP|nr:hypothetical protein HPB51_000336 [Rhipicephalus microplus]